VLLTKGGRVLLVLLLRGGIDPDELPDPLLLDDDPPELLLELLEDAPEFGA
jgi:hypothetical protein